MRDVCVVALALVGCAIAGIARAPADEPQAPVATAAMVVIGWDVATHRIVYMEAVPFNDTWQCEDARSTVTPTGNNNVRYVSQCINPTDAPT